MSTLLRWFSPAYRYALQAEAEGRYVEAARAYALCGQRLKVAEMHLLEAERRGAPASALRELHIATHFTEEKSAASLALRKRLGQLYLRVLKKSVLDLSPGSQDRELCVEAAELLQSAGDPAAAASAYELGGDLERAALAYEQAGDIDRVEALHDAAAARRRAEADEEQAILVYKLKMELGQRKDALAALRNYLEKTALKSGKGEAQRLLFDLQKRILTPGQIKLGHVSGETLYIGRFPLLLGRANQNATTPSLGFPDPGLSREHAQIESGSGGEFLLRDLGSKNGTTLSGLPISDGALPLRSEGELGLGTQVTLRFSVKNGELELSVKRGVARGLRIVVSPAPIPLHEGVALKFGEGGHPQLSAAETFSGELSLNGRRAPRTIELLRGDIIEIGGRRYEVL